MPRFSILLAMAVVALVAVNCAIVRAIVPVAAEPSDSALFLLGLIPLLDAQIISLYWLISSGYRVSVRRRTMQERSGFAPVFAGVNAAALLVLIVLFVLARSAVMGYLDYSAASLFLIIQSFGFLVDADVASSLFQLMMWPPLFSAAMSGVPLLLALIVSWVLRRYKLVVVRRSSPTPKVAADSNHSS